MNQAFNDLVMNDIFVNLLSEKLSDEDLQRIFSLHGEIQFPMSTNNTKKLKTEEQIIINFKSRSHLLRAMAAVGAKLQEIRDDNLLINSLPDDCLVHILSFLPLRDKLNVERVCKRWHDVSGRVFASTKELNFSSYESKKTVRSILKRCGPFTKTLKVSLYHDCENLQMVIQFCKLDQLREIHLDFDSTHRSKLDRLHLTKLLEKTKNLVTLVIKGSPENQDFVQITLLCSTTLENLKIHPFGLEESLEFNLYQFPNLREFSCRNVDILSNEGEMNSKTPRNLEILELRGNKISKSFIDNIKDCTNLRKIILHKNDFQISADNILDIVKNCQKIEYLDLNERILLTPRCFQKFSEMASLETLCISSLGNATTLHLRHLVNVKELTINDCTGVSEHEGFIQLITNSSKLSELSLIKVNVLDERFPEEVASVFSSGLRETPLTLKIQLVDSPWSKKCNHDFHNPLLKLKIIGGWFDYSKLREDMKRDSSDSSESSDLD